MYIYNIYTYIYNIYIYIYIYICIYILCIYMYTHYLGEKNFFTISETGLDQYQQKVNVQVTS